MNLEKLIKNIESDDVFLAVGLYADKREKGKILSFQEAFNFGYALAIGHILENNFECILNVIDEIKKTNGESGAV